MSDITHCNESIHKLELSRKPRQRRVSRHHSIRRAFTLLEIIVVVTIIALLATLVAPKLLSNIWKSKQKIAKSETSSIAQQVQLYCLDMGWSRPPDDMDLSVLATGSSPYLEKDDLKDPWDKPYMLVVPPEHNSDFDILSYGADGQPGGDGENADVWNGKKD